MECENHVETLFSERGILTGCSCAGLHGAVLTYHPSILAEEIEKTEQPRNKLHDGASKALHPIWRKILEGLAGRDLPAPNNSAADMLLLTDNRDIAKSQNGLGGAKHAPHESKIVVPALAAGMSG